MSPRVIKCFPSFRSNEVAAIGFIEPNDQVEESRIDQDENVCATLELCVLCKTGAAICLSSVLDIDQCSTMQMDILNASFKYCVLNITIVKVPGILDLASSKNATVFLPRCYGTRNCLIEEYEK